MGRQKVELSRAAKAENADLRLLNKDDCPTAFVAAISDIGEMLVSAIATSHHFVKSVFIRSKNTNAVKLLCDEQMCRLWLTGFKSLKIDRI
ncbi:hypothetical protein EV132_10499 [Rhizobium sullae]|uniref:Uncharacterized protein n=1 Tax=Rhizobium sullae TaxID=50338 RepID=A0A4R3QG27_RHISU|nr:hypothetical protein EV132_10499 [Rhizobium sullae]